MEKNIRLLLASISAILGTRRYRCPKCRGEFDQWEPISWPHLGSIDRKNEKCPFCGTPRQMYKKRMY